MKLFQRKKIETLSQQQGVPEGTFRCEICGFVQPAGSLCGTVADGAESPSRIYTLCGSCALWLGMGTARFPQGTTFNLSTRQHDKIQSLQAEIEKCGGFERTFNQIMAPTDINDESCRNTGELHKSFEQTHVFLDSIPTLKGLIKFRFSMLSADFLELSTRLTRGEIVAPKEIKRANK